MQQGERFSYSCIAHGVTPPRFSGTATRNHFTQEIGEQHVAAPYAEFMLLILNYFTLGSAERVTDAVHAITGNAPRTFAAYARDYRAAFVG